jgi:hypothetical protein
MLAFLLSGRGCLEDVPLPEKGYLTLHRLPLRVIHEGIGILLQQRKEDLSKPCGEEGKI